jgi:hypothetical protein
MSLDPEASEFADPGIARQIYRTKRPTIGMDIWLGANSQRDAVRSLRRIWGTQDQVAWPPKLRMRPHDLTPLAMAVGEQSSFERAVPRAA